MKKFFEKKPLEMYLDIETAPLVGTAWGTYDTEIVRILHPFYILSFAVKFAGEKVKVHKLPDYKKVWKKDHRDDTELMEQMRDYMDRADVIIAHNGDNFDIKKINTRMLKARIQPPSPFETVDTLKLCKKHFKFDRNKLDYVARELGIGSKLPHLGYDMWERCMMPGRSKEQDKAWNDMAMYNAHDVDPLLEGLHVRLKPWATVHPNANAFTGNREQCPRCFSTNTVKNGVHVKVKTKRGQRLQRHRCLKCGHWFLGDIIKRDE